MNDAQRVFIRPKEGPFPSSPDKNVSEAHYEESKVSITFHGGKTFAYSLQRVAICDRKFEVDPKQYLISKIGEDKPFSNVKHMSFFESGNPEFEDQWCIVFAGKPERYYPESSLIILPSAASYNLFAYLQRVCVAIQDPREKDPNIREYLARQFDRLGTATLSGSAAACYADSTNEPVATRKDEELVIYPFGSNLSQMQSVDNALCNQLSLIEGPPGTGKTQTILNIAANLILRDKTLLVASPNNAATKNVSDKLIDKGYGFLVAALGSKANVASFVDSQPEYPEGLLNARRFPDEIARLRESVSSGVAELRHIYEAQRRSAQNQADLAQWRLEYGYFFEDHAQVEPLRLRGGSGEHLMQARDMLARLAAESDGSQAAVAGFWLKAKASLLWGIGAWKDYAGSLVDIELRINRTLFENTIAELEKQITADKDWLVGANAQAVMKRVTDDSIVLLRAKLAERFSRRFSKEARRKFENPWAEAGEFRKEYPVITSTTDAARNQMGKDGGLFDYVIIDESSQADLITGFLTLSAARNAVVVGDTKQLPCVITNRVRDACLDKVSETGLPARFSYVDQSLLSSLKLCVVEGGMHAPIQLLREHYRCHPAIIGFCNAQFYGGSLIVMSQDKGLTAGDVLKVVSPVQNANYDRTANYNQVQARIFEEDVLPALRLHHDPSQIGVATPYRKQVEGMDDQLNAEMAEDDLRRIEVDTVHKYQGREKDAIAFVTRSNDINDFLNNPNLVNVAVSRARMRLVLIASKKILQGSNNIADLKRYMDYQGGAVVESSVSSSFDLLYPGREREKEAYLESRNARGDEYSEVQVEEWIQNSLAACECSEAIGYLRNYPLKQFLRELGLLSTEERAFVNTDAHADFIFYRKIDKGIVFELEVNGSQHDRGVQLQRDCMKNSILDKVNIPHEVIRTNEAWAQEHARTIVEGMKRSLETRGRFVNVQVDTAEGDLQG